MKRRTPVTPATSQATTHNGEPLKPLPFEWTQSKEYAANSPIRQFRLRLIGPSSPLRVYPGEPRTATFVAVTAAAFGWEVTGWIDCKDARSPEWKHPSGWYEVPRRFLRPMCELDAPSVAVPPDRDELFP